MTDCLSAQIQELSTKISAMDIKFEAKFDAVDVRFDRLENRLDNIELNIIDVKNEQRLMRHALVEELDDVERLKRLHPNLSHS